MTVWSLRLLSIAVVAFGVTAALPAAAQNGPPNALQGFSQNRNEPVKIDAATLEVRDKDKVATFGGNVKLVQGDTTLTCKTLVVFYDQEAGAGAGTMKTAAPVAPGGGKQSIRRLEAKGDVIVIQKEQKATGDKGLFDMQANTVTLAGNVVISQGPQVISGDRLVVNLTTGVSTVECDNSPKGQCRVKALVFPNAGKPDGKPEAGSAPAPGAAPARPPARHHGSTPSGLY